MTQRLILITGGIGSGKSAVGEGLAERGALVIDADAIGHEVLAGAAFEAVAARWPQVVVNGRIDRRALGRLVFGDPEQLAELEAITHPLIAVEIASRISAAPEAVVALEYPLLDAPYDEQWLRVVVDAPQDARISRLIERGMAPDEIEARMRAQPTRYEWLGNADVIIDNHGDLAALADQLDRLMVTPG